MSGTGQGLVGRGVLLQDHHPPHITETKITGSDPAAVAPPAAANTGTNMCPPGCFLLCLKEEKTKDDFNLLFYKYFIYFTN